MAAPAPADADRLLDWCERIQIPKISGPARAFEAEVGQVAEFEIGKGAKIEEGQLEIAEIGQFELQIGQFELQIGQLLIHNRRVRLLAGELGDT